MEHHTCCLPAVVFDLDGTLIDSLPDLCTAANRLLEQEGRHTLTPAQVRPMIGDGARKLVERAFAATGDGREAELDDLTRRFLDIYEAMVAVDTRPFPHVIEALETLRAQGLRLGVCTNKPQHATMELLEALDLKRYFDAVVGGDALPVRKPDPRHVIATLAALGTDTRRAVAVGDSPNDVNAAKAAGVPVVAVSFGYTRVPPPELGADILVDSFAEVPGAVNRLLAARTAPDT